MKNVLERLLNLLAYLLTAARPVTIDDIRHTVAGYDQENDEAFRRMFERDKDVLRTLGIPLERRPTDEWEVEFGYVVPPGSYTIPPLDLTDEERAALWLAAQVVRLGGQPSGPEAIFKLGGAPMSGAGEPLSADLGGASPDLLALTFEAIQDRRLMQFDYRDKPRRVEPLALKHQRGHWYLIAGTAQGLRAFRLDRMLSPVPGGEAGVFQRPKELDLGAVLPDAPWEAGTEELTAEVVFDAEVSWWARRQVPHATWRESPDGSLTATIKVANPDAFVGWLLGFDHRAEIVEPPVLREMLTDRVREAL